MAQGKQSGINNTNGNNNTPKSQQNKEEPTVHIGNRQSTQNLNYKKKCC